ncbi:MAG: acyltransferase [Kiritimatiellae bacterium]|nr:acyltransferase [Kiritimatiellia bacterium]
MISKETSAKFANMSIVCSFFVVCMHVGGEFARGSAGWWISEFTRGGVSRIAVPYFFMASGFFLAGKFSCIDVRDALAIWMCEVRKRVRSLIVPLLIWPIIGMVWAAPFVMVANMLAGRPLSHSIPFLNGVYWPGVGILWFVKFLFVLVLISPVLLLLTRKLGKVWLTIAFFLYWCVFTFLDPVRATGPLGWCVYSFSLEGVAYFSAGMFLREFAVNGFILPLRKSVCFMVLGLLGVLLSITCNLLQIPIGGGNYLNIRHFPVPLVMAGVFGLMPVKRFPEVLVTAAFPVYLMHGMWTVPITCILNHVPFIGATSAYLLKWGFGFGMSVLSASFLRRYVPRVAGVLFGGR